MSLTQSELFSKAPIRSPILSTGRFTSREILSITRLVMKTLNNSPHVFPSLSLCCLIRLQSRTLMKMQALDGVFVMYLSIERASVDLSVEICAGPKGCSKP